MTVALAITLALGYVRFVRRAPPAPATRAAVGDSDLDRRLAAVADALEGARRD